jgi:hypothetical protein
MRQGFFRNIPFRMVAALLLGLTASSAMSAADMTQLSADVSTGLPSAPAQPAGCHSQALPSPVLPVPTSSTPAQRSYRCCVTGHRTAISGNAFSWRPLWARVGMANEWTRFSIATISHFSFEVSISPPGSPPAAVALRI